MGNDVLIALIAFGGTVVGTFGGILASARLTTYRIQQLEKKVDEHNNVIKRTFALEQEVKDIAKALERK